MEKPLVTDDSAPKPTTLPQKRLDCAVSSFRRLSVRLAGGLWLTGTLLWLTVRDQLPEVAWLFYGLPLPLLVFFGGWATAFLPTEPSSPNRPLIVAIGFLFGLAMGFGFGIVFEVADTSVHTARQLQARFETPVLAEIPEIWLEADRLRLRRARVGTAAATLGVVAFALAGGAANYWWVNGASVSGVQGVDVEESQTGGAAGEE